MEIKILRRARHRRDAGFHGSWPIGHRRRGKMRPRSAFEHCSLGAAVDPRRKNGKTPLHEARANGHVECVNVVDGGADVNAVDNNGMQP